MLVFVIYLLSTIVKSDANIKWSSLGWLGPKMVKYGSNMRVLAHSLGRTVTASNEDEEQLLKRILTEMAETQQLHHI